MLAASRRGAGAPSAEARRRSDGAGAHHGRRHDAWVHIVELTADDHAKNNLPDILARWTQRDRTERQNPRTAQSFCVPKADLAAQGYDLSLNRYKEMVHEESEHRAPREILADLAKLEEEIQQGMKELEGMLK